MLRVTIELLPGGDERRKRTIGTAEIANVSPLGETGDYTAVFKEERFANLHAAIRGFPRLTLGKWDLVYRALRVALGDRNK